MTPPIQPDSPNPPTVHAVPRPVDRGRLLGFIGRGAWVLYVLYAVSTIVIAVVGGGEQTLQPLGLSALVAVLGAGVLMVVPNSTPLPMPSVFAVLALCLYATVIVTLELPAEGPLFFKEWHLSSVAFVLFALALRDRILSAWIGMALMLAITLAWSIAVTGDPLRGIGIAYPQPVALLAGTVFAIGLHRTARRIVEVQDAERRRAAHDELVRTAAERRAVELTRVRERVGSALADIADGRAGEPDRRRMAILEASLRDEIRGRALAISPLTDAVAAARETGVEVLLLDDTDGMRHGAARLARVAEWAAPLVADARAGSLTVRLVVAGDGLEATVTHVDEAEGSSVSLRV